MTKEISKLEFWDTAEYKERLADEWFALGMIDPLKYKDKKGWQQALDYERQIKNYIYEIRETDAEKNKYTCQRTAVRKYKPGYKPISWRVAQAKAFKKYGKPDINYMYDPFATSNIDDYYLNYKVADTWCDWIEAHCCHCEGDLGNQLVLLSLEQRSFFRAIFGWKRKEDKMRRYTEILKYIPRKNSKTFDLACMALGTMALDREYGCKVISVATSKDQAKKALAPARSIVTKDKELQIANGNLSNFFKTYVAAITADGDNISFTVLPFKEEVAHGGNFHLSILDEIHVMPDDSMYKVAASSQGSRSQPIICMITTAGTSEESFCNRKFDYAKRVSRAEIEDDEFLPIVYYSDEKELGDNWNDDQVWIRTNPMYGLGKKPRYMAREHKKAVYDPLVENSFKRLDINMVTASTVAAFNMVKYNLCKQNMRSIDHSLISNQKVPDFLLGAKCYAGLDLASKNDMCSLALDFYEHDWVITWSFLPEKGKRKIKDVDRFQKILNVCGEEIINFKELTADFLDILGRFNVQQLGFDVRFATELIQTIQEDKNVNFDCIEIGQSALKINEATRNCVAAILGEEIKHNGCILQLWQFNNAIGKESKDELLLIQKTGTNSTRKIDAVAAWINCRALRIANENEDSLGDRYKETGSFF